MANNATKRGDSSWAFQGCLFAAVFLFVALLIVMLFLTYDRFRENTQPDSQPSPEVSVAPLWEAAGTTEYA